MRWRALPNGRVTRPSPKRTPQREMGTVSNRSGTMPPPRNGLASDWPDEAYRNWRYQRASLARLLANEGMMRDVADAYDDVRKQNAPRRSLRDRLISFVKMGDP